MKTKTPVILLVLATLLSVPLAPGLAAETKKKSPDRYPLTTCVVAGDPLGESDYVTYLHKEAGKPDRTVRFCCDGCIDDFKKEPAKYLAKLDAAAAEMKAKSAKKKKS